MPQPTATLNTAAPATLGVRKQSSALVAALLLLFTCLAFVVHGYHLGIEDEAIYLPAIKKQLTPALYPHDAEFFLSKTKATLFPQMVAWSVRLTRVPLDYAEFAWQFGSIFLFLLGCWRIARQCFRNPREQWAGVALVTSLLTLPVAGTSLYLVDQHLHSRTLASAALLLAIGAYLERRRLAMFVWCVVAFVVHPLVAVFGYSYLVFLGLPLDRWMPKVFAPGAAAVMPFVARPTDAWRQAAYTRQYYWLRNWAWFEWLGIFAPLALLWWFAHLARSIGSPVLARMSTRVIAFGIFQFAVAAVIAIPQSMEFLAPLEPTRYLQLVYLLMLLFAGGLLAHYLLRGAAWRWLVLFVPICAGMFIGQRQLFASSRHIDWPGARPVNPWVQAFDWIKHNTPVDAYFALDLWYMNGAGEDHYGFRAVAERSMLADYGKDAAVAIQVPSLAPVWKDQVDARAHWRDFNVAHFRQLRAKYGVNWIVTERPPEGMLCPYRNATVAVCEIE